MPLAFEQRRLAARRGFGNPFDLAVVSLLTRALQTAVGLFGEATVPTIVTDLHRERLEHSCDVGRSPSPSATVTVYE